MKGKTGKIYILAIICVIALWFFCGRHAVSEAIYPVENGTTWFQRHIATPVNGFFARGSLAKENESLKREIAALKMVRDDTLRIAAENTRLSQFLDIESLSRFPTNQWRCATVLSHGGATGDRNLLRIKGGSLNGVSTNAVVAVPEGLVGRVVDVTPHTAIVQLLTSPKLRVACEIETDEPDVGNLLGILNGSDLHVATSETEIPVLYLVNPYRLRHLKRGCAIPPRAKVITSGLGGLYPRGLRIGSLIDEVRLDETQLEREGDVEPAVDFATLKEVFVRREN